MVGVNEEAVTPARVTASENKLRVHNITRPARLQRDKPVIHAEPDTTGILVDAQIVDLGRIKIGLMKIRDLIRVVNDLAIDTGLSLRLIPDWPVTLMGNDISVLLCLHEKAENRIKQSAFAAVERMAA